VDGVKIGTNIASLNAQRRLSETSVTLAKSAERLSTGMRINHASDDPAGLFISEALRVDSRVFGQALRNVNDAISLTSIADGALAALTNITTRQSELGAQAANGVYSVSQRRAMNLEGRALTDEYNRIVQTAEFNGVALFPDTAADTRIQAGYGLEGSLDFTLAEKLRELGQALYANGQSSITAGSYFTINAADGGGARSRTMCGLRLTGRARTRRREEREFGWTSPPPPRAGRRLRILPLRMGTVLRLGVTLRSTAPPASTTSISE
jgi:flagellin